MGLVVRCPMKSNASTMESAEENNIEINQSEQLDEGVRDDRRVCHDEKSGYSLGATACSWQGTLADYLEIHSVKKCTFVKKPCPSCKAVIGIVDLDVHMKEVCIERTMSCDLCSAKMKARKIDYHLEHKCPEKEVECQLCTERMSRKHIGEHDRSACPKQVIPCPFEAHGCKNPMARENMQEHLKSNTIQHCQLLNQALEQLKEDKDWQDVQLDWEIPKTRIDEITSESGICSTKVKVGIFTTFAKLVEGKDKKVLLIICAENPKSESVLIDRLSFSNGLKSGLWCFYTDHQQVSVNMQHSRPMKFEAFGSTRMCTFSRNVELEATNEACEMEHLKSKGRRPPWVIEHLKREERGLGCYFYSVKFRLKCKNQFNVGCQS